MSSRSIAAFALVSLALAGDALAQQTQTFNHTGAVQYFTVPAGTTSLTVELNGAGGGSLGGAGGKTVASFGVTPGELIAVIVGGAGSTGNNVIGPGGWPGGGTGRNFGGGGGGRSAVARTTPNPPNPPTPLPDLLTAGGGGGGAFNVLGGSGGGPAGGAGSGTNPGGGGSQLAGGLGGGGSGSGSAFAGGNVGFFFIAIVGGGGGGYYGGGAGGGFDNGFTRNGGGGGSGFIGAGATGTTSAGQGAGAGTHGSVTITWVANEDPTANAGADQTVTTCPGMAASVTLDGTGSSDPDGAIASYSWNTSPAASSAQPTVALPIGTHTITLTVTDGQGATDTDTVVITVNPSVVANAGPDQNILFPGGTLPTIALDGTGSTGATVYSWIQTAGPTISLSGASTATPEFVPLHLDGETPYAFQLTASDGSCSQADTVQVRVKHDNVPPSASAGADQSVFEGAAATLSGTGADPDGDPFTLAWTQSPADPVQVALAPTGFGTASFTAPTIAGPHACPPSQVVLHFTITASDGNSQGTDDAAVTVTDVNQRPTGADAGGDQTVCEGATVTLAAPDAQDADGDALTYSWTRIAGTAGPAGPLVGRTVSFTTGPIPAGGSETLTYLLTVSDALGGGDSCALTATDSVDVHVSALNEPPIAVAGGPACPSTVPEGGLVTLDGSASYDPEQRGIASYAWTFVSSDPPGLPVTLAGASTASPSFTAPGVGPAGATLRLSLVVTDVPGAPEDSCSSESLSSTPDTIDVCVAYVNIDPVAVATGASVNEGGSATLDGSQSADPDGNDLTYAWTQTGGPAAALSDASSSRPTFTAPLVACGGATLTFHLEVSDGFGGADAADVTVEVFNVNQSPTAGAGSNATVTEGTSGVTLAGIAGDLDGEPLTSSWIQTGGPLVSLDGAQTLTPSFDAPTLACAGDPDCHVTLTFLLIVTDSCGGSASDEVEITVANEPHDPVASAGGSQSVCEAASVQLDAGASQDPDGDALAYSWTQVSGPPVPLSAAGPLATFTAPWVPADAVLSFLVTVIDPYGGSDTDLAQITVRNCNQPPICAQARPSIAQLWPPNHRMVPISIVGVIDPENNATITITGVTQDEPVDGLGDGDTSPDAIIQGATVLLRAERSGQGNGRVYRITFTSADAEGSCTNTVTVCVPHSMKKPVTCVDDGDVRSYDSTRP